MVIRRNGMHGQRRCRWMSGRTLAALRCQGAVCLALAVRCRGAACVALAPRCRWMRGRTSRRGFWRAVVALAPRRLGLAGVALAVLGGLAAPAGAQVIAGRGFGESGVGFQDVNGNGVLDCLEPVTIRAAYVDPAADTATGSVTGQMMAPFAGANGLAFIPGSVELDR